MAASIVSSAEENAQKRSRVAHIVRKLVMTASTPAILENHCMMKLLNWNDLDRDHRHDLCLHGPTAQLHIPKQGPT